MDPENSNNSEKSFDIEDLDPPELQEAYQKFVDNSNQFLNWGTDFVKWTTTISIAAILWIASTLNGQNHPFTHYVSLSLASFVISIVIAIFIVYYVLTYWAEITTSSLNFLKYLISSEEKYREALHLTAPNMVYFKYSYLDSSKRATRFRDPETFKFLIIIHLLFLLAGLGFYIRSLF